MAEPDSGDPSAWEDAPVFSVSSPTHEIATRRAGEKAGLLHGWLVVGALLVTALCTATVFAFLLALTRQDPGTWWLSVAMIAGSILSLVAIFVLGASVSDEFRRSSVGVWICVAVLGASLLLAGCLLLFGTDVLADESAGAALPYVIEPTVVGALTAVIGLIGSVVAIRRARRQRSESRDDGIRTAPGTIVSVPAPSGWDSGRPRFSDVMVTYPDADGERTLAVTMRTTPRRVPVEGSFVRVRRDADGRMHVEHDPERPMVFAPETEEYDDPGSAASAV